ncbi:MAG: hypothetical protein AB8G23_21825 [Myxococcota bacterium]
MPTQNANDPLTPAPLTPKKRGRARKTVPDRDRARIACLLIPDLPLHAALRAEPELHDMPLAIVSGAGNRAELITLSQAARAGGLRTGLTLPQARAICPEILFRIASPTLERAAREALLDVALSLAPRAELAPRSSGPFVSEGAVYIDASGTESMHGSESAFASVCHARAERAGLRGVVALASSRNIARLAARHLSIQSSFAIQSSLAMKGGFADATNRSLKKPGAETPEPEAPTQILQPKDELAFLAPLPIDLLDPDDRTAEALTRFGIHQIHDLLRLPRRDLAARLGPELLTLVARARGEEIEPPLPEPRHFALEEGIDLESPIASLEPLAFVFRGLISRLVERLTLRSLGCGELRLSLRLENGGQDSRRIGVASPTQDERVLLRLLRLAVENRPPTAALDGVLITCEGIPLRREQLDLFLPRGPSAQALDQTLAELSSICGADRVGRPEKVDDHRPDAFALRPFTAPPQNGKGTSPGRNSPNSAPASDSAHAHAHAHAHARAHAHAPTSPNLTLRAIRPPIRAEVRVTGGRPVFLRSAISQGEVLVAAGPWRTTGHWWSETAHFALDHYDLQMSDGCVLRLCFDWRSKWWQIDGLYD